MKIVVDSNIIFSAILNTDRKIGNLIINGSNYFDFYSVDYLKTEILNHKEKIIKISKYSEDEFNISYNRIIEKIIFIDEILISEFEINYALNLTSDIDINDTLFVALNNVLKSHLWTGDKKLVKGLKAKHYSNIISTLELFELMEHFQARH